jgi:hypothetical protein
LQYPAQQQQHLAPVSTLQSQPQDQDQQQQQPSQLLPLSQSQADLQSPAQEQQQNPPLSAPAPTSQSQPLVQQQQQQEQQQPSQCPTQAHPPPAPAPTPIITQSQPQDQQQRQSLSELPTIDLSLDEEDEEDCNTANDIKLPSATLKYETETCLYLSALYSSTLKSVPENRELNYGGQTHILSSFYYKGSSSLEPEILQQNIIGQMERKHISIFRMIRHLFIDGRSWDA